MHLEVLPEDWGHSTLAIHTCHFLSVVTNVSSFKPRPLPPLGTGHLLCLPADLGFQPSESTHKLKHYLGIITDDSPVFC